MYVKHANKTLLRMIHPFSHSSCNPHSFSLKENCYIEYDLAETTNLYFSTTEGILPKQYTKSYKLKLVYYFLPKLILQTRYNYDTLSKHAPTKG